MDCARFSYKKRGGGRCFLYQKKTVTFQGKSDKMVEDDWCCVGKRAAGTYNNDQCRVFCRIIRHDQGHGLDGFAHSHFVAKKTTFPLGFLLLRHPI